MTELSTSFLEGEMGWSDWVMFRMHVMMCKPCALYLEQIQITVDTLAMVPPEQVDQSVKQNLVDLFRDWKQHPETDA